MRLRLSIEPWTAQLLLALAAVPAAGCGQDSVPGAINTTVCKDAVPLEVGGKDTGYETCANGAFHRRAILACPGGTSGCHTDADCAAGVESWICVCGQTGNQCVVETCKSDADCNGTLCAQYNTLSAQDCPFGNAFACTSPKDECVRDEDCTPGGTCSVSAATGTRTCEHPVCCNTPTCGRPFLVGGTPRSARAAARADWHAASLSPSLDGIETEQRAELAAHWTRAGLMEHASIAAFARFVLQLLSVGAPPDLVIDAQAALADETEHARTCFAFASAYAASAIGPGPIAMSGALDEQDERSILITVVREGCIGETVAALEAAEAAAHATDPVVLAALTKIAEDEGRHALLAWRYAAWAIGRGGDPLRTAAEQALSEAIEETNVAASADDEGTLLHHGIVGASHRAEIRREAMAKVIRPSATALLGIAGPGVIAANDAERRADAALMDLGVL